MSQALYTVGGLNAPITALMTSADKFWLTVLDGETTIYAPDRARFYGYGDRYAARSADWKGANDTFVGSSRYAFYQEFSGDVIIAEHNPKGGNDTITAYGPGAFFGDAVSGAITGGNDSITLAGSSEDIQVSKTLAIAGDAYAPVGKVFGGDDTIRVTYNNSWASSTISGDVIDAVSSGFPYYGDSFVIGGDDAIILMPYSHLVGVFGDAERVWRGSVGGDDIIQSTYSAIKNLSGDFDLLASPPARTGTPGSAEGGDDTITIVNALSGFSVTGDARTTGEGSTLKAGDDVIDGRLSGRGATLFGDVRDSFGYVDGGDDMLIGGALNDNLVGDVGEMHVYGYTLTAGSDTLVGGAGNDKLYGEVMVGRSDTPYGKLEGRDWLDGGDGNDLLLGQAGDDKLTGGLGDDTLNGGFEDRASGNNTALFNHIDQAVTVDLAAGYAIGQGSDVLIDIQNVTGSSKNDAIAGDWAANNLAGGDGDDLLNGRSGKDRLSGGTGADRLFGGDGDDSLIGGRGNDTLSGGEGHDVFQFASHGSGRDTITDLNVAQDSFDLGGGHFSSAMVRGTDTILKYDGGVIVVENVTGLTLGDWNELAGHALDASAIVPSGMDYLL